MFRFKRSIPLDYNAQGYIYFRSLRYRGLPEREKKKIRDLCAAAGGEYQEAVLAFVTGEEGANAIYQRYYISRSTLERMVRKYYLLWE